MNHAEKVQTRLAEFAEAEACVPKLLAAVTRARTDLQNKRQEAARTIKAVYGSDKTVLFGNRIYRIRSGEGPGIDLDWEEFDGVVLPVPEGCKVGTLPTPPEEKEPVLTPVDSQ